MDWAEKKSRELVDKIVAPPTSGNPEWYKKSVQHLAQALREVREQAINECVRLVADGLSCPDNPNRIHEKVLACLLDDMRALKHGRIIFEITEFKVSKKDCKWTANFKSPDA